MDVDEALGMLGSVGRWQVVFYITLSLAVMFPTAFHMLAIVYIGYKPPHHCKLDTNAIINHSIPYENGKLSSCKMYANNTGDKTIVDCVNGWEYSVDDGPTIITKWDLVCDKGYYAQSSQTILVIGVMIGPILFTVSKRNFAYGREDVKKTPMICFRCWLTFLKNQSLGTSSFVGRIGNFLATFVTYVIERYPRFPALLFGCLSVLASLAVTILPETHNKPFPETIEDIEEWFDDSKQRKNGILEEEIKSSRSQ